MEEEEEEEDEQEQQEQQELWLVQLFFKMASQKSVNFVSNFVHKFFF